MFQKGVGIVGISRRTDGKIRQEYRQIRKNRKADLTQEPVEIHVQERAIEHKRCKMFITAVIHVKRRNQTTLGMRHNHKRNAFRLFVIVHCNFLAEFYSDIQFGIKLLDITHVTTRVTIHIRASAIVQINRKECKARRVRLFGKFLLEIIVVVAMHVQDDTTQAHVILRIRTRRTPKWILNQRRAENFLAIGARFNRVNFKRLAEFHVHLHFRQGLFNNIGIHINF